MGEEYAALAQRKHMLVFFSAQRTGRAVSETTERTRQTLHYFHSFNRFKTLISVVLGESAPRFGTGQGVSHQLRGLRTEELPGQRKVLKFC